MAIPFSCPHCGRHTEVAEEYAGQSGPCASCGKTITVPPLSGTPGYNTPTRGSPVPLVVLLVAVVLGLLLFLCSGVFFLAFRAVPAPVPPPAVATAPATAPAIAANPAPARAEVRIDGPPGTTVSRQDESPEARALTVPISLYVRQGSTCPLQLANVAEHPGVQFAATLDVAPATPRTEPLIRDGAIRFEVTREDLERVLDGEPVTKVTFLPGPAPQEQTPEPGPGNVETLVNTDLEPGVDPLAAVAERGDCLAALRVEAHREP